MMYHTRYHQLLSFLSGSKLSLSVCSLLLVLLLAACGSGGGSTGTAPTSPSGSTSAPTQTTPAASMTTYTNDLISISYPHGWTVAQGAAGSVTFSDAQGNYLAIAVTPNPNGTHPTSDVLNNFLEGWKSGSNYQKVDVAPTMTVGGDTWDQIAAITDEALAFGQQVRAEDVEMADNHPASSATTQLFQISYATEVKNFDQINSTVFQPMLQSFKFL